MNPELESALQEYCHRCDVKPTNRGTACVLLFTTRYAREHGLPVDASSLRSRNGGQVARFSFRSVNRILAEYSPEWVDLGEAGRTNLANVWRAEQYLALLNQLHEDGIADLRELEGWWADRVIRLATPQPIPFQYPEDQPLSATYRDLVKRVQRLHRHDNGADVERLVARYLVRAVLQVSSTGRDEVRSRVRSNLDAQPDVFEYEIGDIVITVAIPFRRSAIQGGGGRRTGLHQKVVVTTDHELAMARTSAKLEGTANRIQVISTSQFLDFSLVIAGGWSEDRRMAFTRQLVDVYNREATSDNVAADYLLALR